MNFKWYWSLDKIPELQEMAPQQRRKVWRKYYGRILGHWGHWLGVILFIILYWFFVHRLALALVTSMEQIPILILCLGLFFGLVGFLYSEILLNMFVNRIHRDKNANEFWQE